LFETGRIEEIIFATIDEFNEFQTPDKQIDRSSAAVLFGSGGRLDSHGLVVFIVAVEERLAARLGVDLTITDDHAMSEASSPFRTVRSLTEYVRERINGRQGGKS
jgi:acyl carrier protein